MFGLRKLSPDHPTLDRSRLLSLFYLAIEYAQENDGIGLTKAGFFNRKFCHWMAERYDWPEYSAEYLLQIQRTLDEMDVPPVEVLHDLCDIMKLGRKRKGKFQFTKPGLSRMADKGVFFAMMTECFLVIYKRQFRYEREFTPLGNWDVFINVLNIEAEKGGVTSKEMLKVYYGFEDVDHLNDSEASDHYFFVRHRILEPLVWLGLLDQTPDLPDYKIETVYTKTDLWRAALHLDEIPDFVKAKLH